MGYRLQVVQSAEFVFGQGVLNFVHLLSQ